MSLSAAQQKSIMDLETWASDPTQTKGNPPSPGLTGRMNDLLFEEVPLSALSTPEPKDPEFVAGPGTQVAIRIRSARCTVTVKDRTGWPVEGVTVEIWSQAIGRTDDQGIWNSPAFFAGQYPIKFRAQFIGATTGGPRDPVLPFEIEKVREFPATPCAFEFQLSLSASGLSLPDRAGQVLHRMVPLVPGEMKHQLRQLLSRESIIIFATLAGLWAAGHLVAVGEIADAIAFAAILIKLGLNVALATSVAHDLISAVTIIAVGKTEFDLDDAAHALARVIGTIGLLALMQVVTVAVKKAGKNPGEYRPKKAPPENVVEPPPVATTAAALESPLGQKLSSIVGKDVLKQRLEAVEASARRDPTLQGIPKEDLASLRGYTSDLPTKAATAHSPGQAIPDYAIINKALRTKDAGTFGALAEYVDSALRAYHRLPKIRCKSERWVDLTRTPKGFVDLLRPGKVFKDRGFASTSSVPNATRAFGGNQRPMVLYIQGYSGRNVARLSEIPSEAEILFRPGVKFFVASRKVVNGVLQVTLFEIRQDAHEFVALWGSGQTLIANLKSLLGGSKKSATTP